MYLIQVCISNFPHRFIALRRYSLHTQFCKTFESVILREYLVECASISSTIVDIIYNSTTNIRTFQSVTNIIVVVLKV